MELVAAPIDLQIVGKQQIAVDRETTRDPASPTRICGTTGKAPQRWLRTRSVGYGTTTDADCPGAVPSAQTPTASAVTVTGPWWRDRALYLRNQTRCNIRALCNLYVVKENIDPRFA